MTSYALFLRIYVDDKRYIIRCENELSHDVQSNRLNFTGSWALKKSTAPLSMALDFFNHSELPIRQPIQISNVCGTMPPSLYNRCYHSPAWVFKKTAMGMSHVCYTLHGHFTLMGNNSKLVFRGAKSPKHIAESAHDLFRVPVDNISSGMRIQLAVMSCTLNRCVVVQSGCILEQMLAEYDWCFVVKRLEEMYNSVLFHIVDFEKFMKTTGVRDKYSDEEWNDFVMNGGLPNKGTVSVTRRGFDVLFLFFLILYIIKHNIYSTVC